MSQSHGNTVVSEYDGVSGSGVLLCDGCSMTIVASKFYNNSANPTSVLYSQNSIITINSRNELYGNTAISKILASYNSIIIIESKSCCNYT